MLTSNPEAKAVQKVFVAALLLTRNESLAEMATLHAISEWKPGVEFEAELVQLGAQKALELFRCGIYPIRSASACSPGLPPELISVLELPTRLRQAFVLRILLQQPEEWIAEQLNLTIPGVSTTAGNAAVLLGHGTSRKGPLKLAATFS